jgi:outer membrane lipoprotein carrier protein
MRINPEQATCHPERSPRRSEAKAGSRGIPWKSPLSFHHGIPRLLSASFGMTALHRLGKTKVIFLFLFLFALLPAHAQTMSPGDIKSLLARIRDQRAASPNMQADFAEQRKIHLLDDPITSSGKVWFQAPNKFRLERKGNSPSVTVSDGALMWIYYPKFKSAERYSLGKRSPLDAAIAAITTALNLQDVENSFHIAAAKTANGYDLELTPRNPSMKRIFQKLDLRLNNDLFAERTEMIQPNGDRIVTVYTNPAHAVLPESTFEFNPPAGTDISTPLGK